MRQGLPGTDNSAADHRASEQKRAATGAGPPGASRRWLDWLLVVGAVVGVAAASWVGWGMYERSAERRDAFASARATLVHLEAGRLDEARPGLYFGQTPPEQVEPALRMLTALTRLDAAMRDRWDDGLERRPLPNSRALRPGDVTLRGETATLHAPGRDLRLVRTPDGWKIDASGVAAGELPRPGRALALADELDRLTARIEAGDLETLPEARRAYQQALVRGTLHGLLE